MNRRTTLVTIATLAIASVAGATQVVVGQVVPLTGLDASQGRAYSAGMDLCFAMANKAGGVNGNTFALVRKDDGGRTEDTLALTRQLLVESRPLLLAGYFGNRNIDALVASGILEQEKISLVGYRVSEVIQEPARLYSVRAGLREEIHKFAEHVATIGITRLGLVYEDSPNATVLLKVADEAATKTGTVIAARGSYPRGTARMTAAVEAMQSARPQAILIVGSGAAAAGFIEQYRGGAGNALLFAQSGADIEQLSKRLSEEQMQGVAIAQVTPSPYQIRTRIAKELTDALSAKTGLEVPVSYSMMEGYIACKVIVEAVRRQGARVSREGTASALDGMSSYDLGGYLISYRPGMRLGSRLVELSIISSKGRIRQ